jgi:hypothetical protein
VLQRRTEDIQASSEPFVIPPRVRKWMLYALILVAAGLLAGGGVAIYRSAPEAASANSELILVGQNFIRNTIKDELRTTFGDANETRVEVLGGDKFLVAGWVDVVMANGSVARHDFSCVIHKTSSEEWVGEQIAVIPQEL